MYLVIIVVFLRVLKLLAIFMNFYEKAYYFLSFKSSFLDLEENPEQANQNVFLNICLEILFVAY